MPVYDKWKKNCLCVVYLDVFILDFHILTQSEKDRKREGVE